MVYLWLINGYQWLSMVINGDMEVSQVIVDPQVTPPWVSILSHGLLTWMIWGYPF